MVLSIRPNQGIRTMVQVNNPACHYEGSARTRGYVFQHLTILDNLQEYKIRIKVSLMYQRSVDSDMLTRFISCGH